MVTSRRDRELYLDEAVLDRLELEGCHQRAFGLFASFMCTFCLEIQDVHALYDYQSRATCVLLINKPRQRDISMGWRARSHI